MKTKNNSQLKHLAERRRRVAEVMGLRDEILLIGAGKPIPIPEGTDQTYPFFAQPEYYYLTGIDSPGGVLAFDPRQSSSKRCVSFFPDVTDDEKRLEGRTQPIGTPLPRLEPWLGERRGRQVINLGVPLRGVRSDEGDVARTREQFTHVRRAKDEIEVGLLRRAAIATAKGFAVARRHIRAGITERALQIELEAEFFRNGADGVGFPTIVGSGPNSAVLHFPPSPRKIRRGDF